MALRFPQGSPPYMRQLDEGELLGATFRRDPRGVLEEFGVEVPVDVEFRVWDSTAEIRYLVIPQRPAGTVGWSEDELAQLVTRDSMIGVGLPLDPAMVEQQVGET